MREREEGRAGEGRRERGESVCVEGEEVNGGNGRIEDVDKSQMLKKPHRRRKPLKSFQQLG